MTSDPYEWLLPAKVVLADANVIYSRVLRDYLLYAADEGVIAIAWSQRIIDEALEHLVGNRPTFTRESAEVLGQALTDTYPQAIIEPGQDDYRQVEDVPMIDEDDRHVLAAAVAAEADLLCTSNIKHFPVSPISRLGIEIITPDALLSRLIGEYPTQMLAAHRTTVASFRDATDTSTLAALRRAQATDTADAFQHLLNTQPQ